MKIKEFKELLSKEAVELEKLVLAKKSELFQVYAKMTQNKEKNVKIARNLRKEIAQILTVLSNKKLENK